MERTVFVSFPAFSSTRQNCWRLVPPLLYAIKFSWFRNERKWLGFERLWQKKLVKTRLSHSLVQNRASISVKFNFSSK